MNCHKCLGIYVAIGNRGASGEPPTFIYGHL